MPDSYADLSHHYDLLMTSGYYDYGAYAHDLLACIGTRRHLLELGVGTGLACERILDLGPADLSVTGIDHTEGMLARARERLGDRARLFGQDILDLHLPRTFDVAYSVGGVWCIIQDEDGPRLGSHLMDEEDNAAALDKLAAVLRPGALFLLSVQGPHRPLERSLPGGLRYVQDVVTDADGRCTKDYYIERDGAVVAHQRLRFRLFPQDHADRLLQRHGFAFRGHGGLLRQYIRR
ncbi:class I SAM-dependent DNA methyltransferase [Streptomyces sp. NPDC055189]